MQFSPVLTSENSHKNKLVIVIYNKANIKNQAIPFGTCRKKSLSIKSIPYLDYIVSDYIKQALPGIRSSVK